MKLNIPKFHVCVTTVAVIAIFLYCLLQTTGGILYFIGSKNPTNFPSFAIIVPIIAFMQNIVIGVAFAFGATSAVVSLHRMAQPKA